MGGVAELANAHGLETDDVDDGGQAQRDAEKVAGGGDPADAAERSGPLAGSGQVDGVEARHGEADDDVDYLGFGPIYPTRTKGYERGLGPEAAWVAQSATALPVFPIGGIDATNAADLVPVGRAAVSSAILGADDPARAAREIRALLERPGA